MDTKTDCFTLLRMHKWVSLFYYNKKKIDYTDNTMSA